MEGFEEMLGKILSDPAEMGKIADLASSLMSGEKDGADSRGTPELSSILGKLGGGGDKAALVEALGPYLKPERKKKLEKALRISRLAGMAEIAMQTMGDGDV